MDQATRWKDLCENIPSPFFRIRTYNEIFFKGLEELGCIVTLEEEPLYIKIQMRGYKKDTNEFCIGKHLAKKKPPR
jgi:hypothetical protein